MGAVRLEIQGTTTLYLAVEGALFPSLEAEYKSASQPRQIVALRETWEVRGCRLVTSDGSATSTWSQWLDLKSRVSTRNSEPTYARFVFVETGAVLHTLGPTAYEDFQIDAVQGEQDPDVPAASWRSTATFTLRFSAVKRNADTNGIVTFDQVVSNTWPDSRHLLEWRTRITTVEGTSAADKAKAYAALTSAIVNALGGGYLYVTNGPDGIEYVEVDADEQNSRTPTVCEAVSSIRDAGTTVGFVTPGASPSDVTYSVTTRTSATETVTTTVAEATGPGAVAFVTSKRPDMFNESEETEGPHLTARGVWSLRFSSGGSGGATKDSFTGIKVTVSGGSRVVDFESVADDGDPVESIGSFLSVTAVADLVITATGIEGRDDELPLPGHPGEPWVYDSAQSTEGEPYPESKGGDPSMTTWRREAHLVFKASVAPSTSLGQALLRARPTPSYVYGKR